MNNMQNYIKLTVLGIFVLGGMVYMFVFGPKYLSAKDIRQNQLADREFFLNMRNSAMGNLKICFANAQKNYDNYWARACKSISDKQIDICITSNIPETACKNKFQYSGNCELPTFQATAAQSFLSEMKNECNVIYKYEAASIQDK